MFARKSLLHAAALACVSIFVSPTLAQTTSPTTFTYQGSLSSSGSPLSGQADLRAQLFDAPTDGSPVGNPINLPNTSISNGLFTVPLDFGPAFDHGQPRWIEFSVRAPAGSGPFTPLQPRQAITPTPLAQGLAGIALSRSGPRTLDQAQDQIGSVNVFIGIEGPVWQSWTATISGSLTEIEVIANNIFGDSAPLSLTIRSGVGLSGPIVGSTTVTGLPINSVTPTSIPLPSIPIQAGRAYTVEFTAGFVSLRSAAVAIPGAIGFRSAGSIPWWFRTYVTPSASIDARASTAAYASFAGTAMFAQSASSLPWSGLVGTAGVTTPAIGTNWQFFFNNSDVATFRGAARLSDAGFLELTNSANILNPSFARLNSAGAWTAVSDARLKTNITTADNTLAAALKLRPVHFRWKSSGQEDLGLIAQEVRTVLPSLVSGDELKDTLTLNYSQLSVVAIGAIQELQREIQTQQRIIQSQLRELQTHTLEIQRLQAAIAERDTAFADLKARVDQLEHPGTSAPSK